MDYFDQFTDVSRKVIAPVQYFPLLGLNKNSKFHQFNQIAKQEIQGNVPVYHPRYITIPGTTLINVADAMLSAAEKILPEAYPGGETFDLVDGHYLYPDGIAAYKLAKKHQKPLFLTARGSDVNFWMEQEDHKPAILEAIHYAHKVICVSQALKDRLIHHGVSKDKLVVLMNGVDRTLFNADVKPGPDEGYLLTVGNLVPLKGHEFILQVLQAFPAEKLIIIGAGELETSLKALAQKLQIADRVSFLPHVPHDKLPPYYAGAKATILMSSMEGMPNVVLESLATGIPVIATAVGGIPEIVTTDNGILLSDRSTEALKAALDLGREKIMTKVWQRETIAQSAASLDWQETSYNLRHLFTEVL